MVILFRLERRCMLANQLLRQTVWIDRRERFCLNIMTGKALNWHWVIWGNGKTRIYNKIMLLKK